MLNIITIALLLLNRKKHLALSLLHSVSSLPHSRGATFYFSSIIIFVLLTLLPFLAAGGAISLNNGGQNTLTMILFALIPVLFMVLIWRKEFQPLHPYAIFMMGLAILFTNSLRGWYITGHDIHHEYTVFQNTFTNSLWPVRVATGDPYNACLSITILPTIIAKITTINPMYVYKVVFQIIFAFGLIPIYLLIKKLGNTTYALIGAFLFITFPTFLDDMPFLNRQEIAYIFFALLILTTFSDINKKSKVILTSLLLISITISHYSSNYVTLGILVSSWIFYQIIKRMQAITIPFEIPVLRLPIIIGAFLLTFLWNYQITMSTSNLKSTIIQTVTDFKNHRQVKDDFAKYNLLLGNSANPEKEFEDYVKKQSISAQYVPPYNLPLTSFGKTLSGVINVEQFNYGIHTFIADLYQILIVVGVILFFFRQGKLSQKREGFYATTVLSAVSLLVVFTILPRLAVDYSIIRLVQQTLILTALPILLACEFIFKFTGRLQQYITALLFVVLFLHSSGFIPQLTGGYKPQLSLNNSGQYYDFFYTHGSDVLGTEWLADNRDKSLPVFHDVTSDLQGLNYTPQTDFLHGNKITREDMASGYIYEGYINVVNRDFRTFNSGDLTEYTDNNITSNKDLIYSNGESNIFAK
ncbi:MAG TPA: DUF2206 domain-containing protein, partial [Candidatus Babeliales bacterium]|nr:DUF2206 domain-containing protein [Candidatus Babeliales bacterium]